MSPAGPVVPEEMLYFPVIGERRSGLIGFPILAALKELTFTRSRKLLVISSDVFDGSVALDIMAGREALTLNYESMRLSLR